MKPTELKELINFIASSGLEEVNIETEGFKLAIKRSSPQATVSLQAAPQLQAAPVVAAPAPAAAAQPAPAAATKPVLVVKSPMIGTFYQSPSPDKPAYVAVGDEIRVGQTICIIEAMKLFNEIESDVAGRVVRVLVNNASPVEYDQPLFEIEPLG